jgi:hypothetical protein
MNAITLSILIVLISVILAAPQKWALLGMAAGVLYLTQWTSVSVAGLNMFPMRFLEIAGIVRVMARREWRFINLNTIDRLLLLFYSYITIVFLLRSDEGQAYRIGIAVDAMLCYFTFRALIGDENNYRWFLRAFVILLIPYVSLLFVEMRTNQNPFSLLGGQMMRAFFREGRIRCIGSFREYAILGSMGASFLPLYIGLCFFNPKRLFAITGILLCLAIVWFSNSAGPLIFAIFVILGWILWIFRDRMFLVRRTLLAMIIAMDIAMKAPIWYLPTHFSFGGAAWHRSYLIEVAMIHISEWWFWGMPASKTENWFATKLLISNSADITNQFIAYGLAGGLMAIALFVWLLIKAFQSLGKELAAVRSVSPRPSETEYLLWGLGVMLAGHIVNFFAITYFDQFYVIWLMQLAAISNLTLEYRCARLPAH